MATEPPKPEPEKPAEAIPADEPFEWSKYLKRVDESVTAAEQYLEVPPGTISSIPHDPDFIAIVKTYAVVEPMLNDLISKHKPWVADESYQSFVATLNISGRSSKIALAKSLRLLKEDQVRFIEGVARVRNRYAHNVRNMHRTFADILTEEQHNNGKIVEHVTGAVTVLPAPALAPYLKMLMYHRLADYLSDALHTLRPPPLPGGLADGLLGFLANRAKSNVSASTQVIEDSVQRLR